jgi:hypothetical protein
MAPPIVPFITAVLVLFAFVVYRTVKPTPSQVSFPDPPSVMEEYVLPDEYTLPSISTPIPQVPSKAHRWSASSVWGKHRNKIIGGIVGGVALVVAGGIAKRNRVRLAREKHNENDRQWHRGLKQVESDLAYEQSRADVMERMRIMAEQARERAEYIPPTGPGYTEEEENAFFDEYDDDMDEQEQNRVSIRNFKRHSRELIDKW